MSSQLSSVLALHDLVVWQQDVNRNDRASASCLRVLLKSFRSFHSFWSIWSLRQPQKWVFLSRDIFSRNCMTQRSFLLNTHFKLQVITTYCYYLAPVLGKWICNFIKVYATNYNTWWSFNGLPLRASATPSKSAANISGLVPGSFVISLSSCMLEKPIRDCKTLLLLKTQKYVCTKLVWP